MKNLNIFMNVCCVSKKYKSTVEEKLDYDVFFSNNKPYFIITYRPCLNILL